MSGRTITPDICVIGAGSGGLTVAAAAAAFGVSVVLIEKGEMGGDCLNYGCVPSKALLAAARHAQAMREAPQFGVGVPGDGEPEVDFGRVNDHVRAVIGAIAPNDSQERFTAMGVTVIREHARFVDQRTVEAGDVRIKARRFVVATGSSPMVPPIPGLDTVDYLTNETLFDNRRRPRHLVIIGGGPIGMEMAQAHRRLGSQVTVIEAAKALGKDDPELAGVVLRALRREAIDIREGAAVVRVEPRGKSGVRVIVRSDGAETAVDGSHLLVATGRVPNTAGLDLEKAGIAHDRKGIEVDSTLRTSNRRVYTIGDVAGSLQFTHVANYHAGLVVRAILFRLRAKPDLSVIPWATYTDPELAHVGRSDEQARARHGTIRVLRWPYHENDRAQAERRTEGMIKLVTGKRGRLLGVSIAGADAGEMINMWALALSAGMKLRDVVGYVAPYPTLAEIGKRAATSHYAPMARRPLVRWLVGFLRRFG
ncbi:MAG: FAD-dependent oxidoreductase [Pseudomonadota bacterium]|nr:FAD-dependent oxidoreductase [Pseudomonadota bacterium]